MKFKDFPYSRPDLEKLKGEFKTLLEQFKGAESFHEQDRLLMAINSLRGKFDSMSQIASIRQTIDTNDTYYEREQEFFHDNLPIYRD